MLIRRAKTSDIPDIDRLLYQVCAVHAAVRPDLFRAGGKKYTDAELCEIIADDTRPIFVYEKNGRLCGYAFCIFRKHENEGALNDLLTLYIDDLCVDESCRARGLGRALYEHVLTFAESSGCYNVTLNVWAGNDSARRFYENLGLKPQKYGMETIITRG